MDVEIMLFLTCVFKEKFSMFKEKYRTNYMWGFKT